MAAVLTDFLQRAAAAPFVLGELDCSLFLVDWVREVTGTDIAADLRGTYSTDAGWQAIVAAGGSLEAVIGGRIAAAGYVAIDPGEAKAGDVGVVHVTALGLTAGAITSGGGRWVTKLERGVTRLRSVPIAAWGLR